MKPRARSRSRLAVLAAGVLLAAVPALAADTIDQVDKGWQIRFYAAAVDMEHSTSGLTRPAGTGRGYGTDTGGGLGFNGEYRFSRRLGLDLGVFSGGSVDIEAHTYRAGGAGWVTYDTLTFTPLTVGLDIHLTPASRVDVYVCPLVALIRYGELTTYSDASGFTTAIDFSDDVAPGFAVGLGVPFGDTRWSFQGNITYLDSSLEGRGTNGVRIDSGYDSTIFGVGVGYSFRSRSP